MAVITEELEGSPKYSYSRKSGTAQRMFRLNGLNVQAFLSEVFPDPFLAGDGRYEALPAAVFPGQPWLVADKASVEPWDANSPVGDGSFPALFDTVKVTITYKDRPHNQNKTNQKNSGPGGSQGSTGGQQNTFVTHKVTIGGEYLLLPGASLQWATASDPTYDKTLYPAGPPPALIQAQNNHAGITIPTIEHSLHWSYVLFPPWTAMRQAMGRVNSLSFAGAPNECLLFIGFDTSRKMTSQGLRLWELDYKFSEKNYNAINPNLPQGWNHFLRTDGLSSGQFQRMSRAVPRGQTLISTLGVQPNDTSVIVKSAESFPKTGNFWFMVGGNPEVLQGVRVPSNPKSISVPGGFAFGHSIGQSITQIFPAKLSGGLTSSQKSLAIQDATTFPAVAGFRVQIDNEIMQIGSIDTPTSATVVRGMQGTVPTSHSGGASINVIPSPLYDLYDFRKLFQMVTVA
jgi:hypothetical protein